VFWVPDDLVVMGVGKRIGGGERKGRGEGKGEVWGGQGRERSGRRWRAGGQAEGEAEEETGE
jgi:hypothetical protein